MSRVRSLALIGLLATLAMIVGCGKKADPSPTATDAPTREPTPEEVRAKLEKEKKADAAEQLKQIGIAMHHYEQSRKAFPAGVVGPKGHLGLSWRVQILPYIEELPLYKEFKQDEAWDSEHNKKLISKMPKLFASMGKDASAGKTHLRSFAGSWGGAFMPTLPPAGKVPAPPFPHLQAGQQVPGIGANGVIDGLSNTLMVAEAVEAVEWTKPDDLPFVWTGPDSLPAVPKLGGIFPGGFHGLMCDGNVYFFPSTLSDKSLRALITTAANDTFDDEVYAIIHPQHRPGTATPSKGGYGEGTAGSPTGSNKDGGKAEAKKDDAKPTEKDPGIGPDQKKDRPKPPELVVPVENPPKPEPPLAPKPTEKGKGR